MPAPKPEPGRCARGSSTRSGRSCARARAARQPDTRPASEKLEHGKKNERERPRVATRRETARATALASVTRDAGELEAKGATAACRALACAALAVGCDDGPRSHGGDRRDRGGELASAEAPASASGPSATTTAAATASPSAASAASLEPPRPPRRRARARRLRRARRQNDESLEACGVGLAQLPFTGPKARSCAKATTCASCSTTRASRAPRRSPPRRPQAPARRSTVHRRAPRALRAHTPRPRGSAPSRPARFIGKSSAATATR